MTVDVIIDHEPHPDLKRLLEHPGHEPTINIRIHEDRYWSPSDGQFDHSIVCSGCMNSMPVLVPWVQCRTDGSLSDWLVTAWNAHILRERRIEESKDTHAEGQMYARIFSQRTTRELWVFKWPNVPQVAFDRYINLNSRKPEATRYDHLHASPWVVLTWRWWNGQPMNRVWLDGWRYRSQAEAFRDAEKLAYRQQLKGRIVERVRDGYLNLGWDLPDMPLESAIQQKMTQMMQVDLASPHEAAAALKELSELESMMQLLQMKRDQLQEAVKESFAI